ncbi:hypothetical protein JQ596_28810 [Bradyrhizobium manausense]|uniref:hypothetical protein n=1 Tax=Bradyrhizobium TaxID=374 RepID=UPI001BAD69DF|nr:MULTISPECIES: hypothetical protein [Bradyrhizobium]MBR0829543.1 hypothetical protein [Bradyrhizobium manausense]UVO25913.1 hypothetical protein KUF59_25450 [Bradyrhizobium arachidis]
METLSAYLDRKHEELKLLNGCLGSALALRKPVAVTEVIEQKFRLAAALKAEHALHDWALTETAWAHSGRLRAGPFEFSYDYQRADLDVRGPSFYEFEEAAATETIYTSSGMAAISALLLGSARVIPKADILVLPGSYGETIELIESLARHLRLVRLEQSPSDVAARANHRRILLLDSCAPAAAFEATLRCDAPELDLVIFDTTCLSIGSGRIRRVLNWTRRARIPIVLVRSHTKLDSLGLEYGRLGSAAFAAPHRRVNMGPQLRDGLVEEMRRAVRLLGGAALPAHFPPYVGTKAYRDLTDRRGAAILRNGRRTARYFASALPRSSAELHFAHGLYVTLAPKRPVDESQARQIAADLSGDLGKAGLLLRHAGSFGFDFGAAEWFHDTTCDRYLVRIAVPDLPTPLWDEIATAVAYWWSLHEQAPRLSSLPASAPA